MIIQETSLANSRNRTRLLLIASAIYSIVQIGLYAATVAQVPCSQANNIIVTVMCTYVAQFLSCLLFVYVLTAFKMRVFGIILAVLTTVYKLLSVIYLGIVGGTHLGDCYILASTRNMMVSTLCIDFGLMIVIIICVELVRGRIEAIALMNKSLQGALNTDQSSDRAKATFI